MKGGLEGRRLEFSTSVTLAGLSIMCDVVEAKRRSESGRVGCLQARSHVFHPWTQDRIGFFTFLCCSKASQEKSTFSSHH